jgi:hypothetical protein
MRWLALISFFLVPAVLAANPWPKALHEHGVAVRVRPNTPPQMAAFYEARGFPAAALAEVKSACFMTVGVTNERAQVLWLEPRRWILTDADGKKVELIDFDHWNRLWERHQVPAAARTAFRWTQLPESRDLRPHEPVGGNISFKPGKGPYTLNLRFRLGPNRTGGEVKVRISGIVCARQSD